MSIDLVLERGTKRKWKTYYPVTWDVGSVGSGRTIVIPAGTEFESSVPKFATWFIHPDDPRFLLAALVHDYLLEVGSYGRLQAAAEWYDGAKASNAPTFKAKVGFIAISVWCVLIDK